MKLLRHHRNIRMAAAVAVAVFFEVLSVFSAEVFVHPGGLHTLADLERMRTNVLAGNHPWIDGWQQMLRDPQSQSDWRQVSDQQRGVVSPHV